MTYKKKFYGLKLGNTNLGLETDLFMKKRKRLRYSKKYPKFKQK